MGREIRRVPPNWQHPTDGNGNFIPLLDRTYQDRMAEWQENSALWSQGRHLDQTRLPGQTAHIATYAQWDDEPPQPHRYRPAFQEEPTWHQVYETVTEGTPLTPPFETLEALANHLVSTGAATRDQATAFIRDNRTATFILNGWDILPQVEYETLLSP